MWVEYDLIKKPARCIKYRLRRLWIVLDHRLDLLRIWIKYSLCKEGKLPRPVTEEEYQNAREHLKELGIDPD
jgi:hypothetical protein